MPTRTTMETVLIGIPCLMVGGTEMQTLRLAQALTEGGYRVVVCCYFEYRFEVVQMFQRAGCTVTCLSAYGTRPKGLWAQLRFLQKGLRRVVREYRPSKAHVQYMAPGALPLWCLRRMGVKDLYATLHTTADHYGSLRLVRWLQRHWVKVFTCVSQTAERGFFGSSSLYTTEAAVGRHSHFTLYNCLPPNMQAAPCATTGHLTIGVVARLERIKGTDLVFPAFASVLRRIPTARLVVVGDGSLRQAMERQQADLRIPEERVTWAGRLPHERLPEQYAQMDIAWMPSRSEGFGLGAVEAMAQGVPVVAAHVGGLAEVIADGQDGLLVPAEDSEALAQATITLWEDGARRHTLAERGRERAAEFSFAKYKELVLSLYGK